MEREYSSNIPVDDGVGVYSSNIPVDDGEGVCFINIPVHDVYSINVPVDDGEGVEVLQGADNLRGVEECGAGVKSTWNKAINNKIYKIQLEGGGESLTAKRCKYDII